MKRFYERYHQADTKLLQAVAVLPWDIPFDKAEKSALFDVNLPVEGFQKMAGEA